MPPKIIILWKTPCLTFPCVEKHTKNVLTPSKLLTHARTARFEPCVVPALSAPCWPQFFPVKYIRVHKQTKMFCIALRHWPLRPSVPPPPLQSAPVALQCTQPAQNVRMGGVWFQQLPTKRICSISSSTRRCRLPGRIVYAYPQREYAPRA